MHGPRLAGVVGPQLDLTSEARPRSVPKVRPQTCDVGPQISEDSPKGLTPRTVGGFVANSDSFVLSSARPFGGMLPSRSPSPTISRGQ